MVRSRFRKSPRVEAAEESVVISVEDVLRTAEMEDRAKPILVVLAKFTCVFACFLLAEIRARAPSVITWIASQ